MKYTVKILELKSTIAKMKKFSLIIINGKNRRIGLYKSNISTSIKLK